MWATGVVTKTIDKKSSSSSTSTLPLEKYLTQTRADFIQKRKEVPALLKKAEQLEAKACVMTRRFECRQRRDLEHHARSIREECKVRMSMQRENEYEQIISPYLNAYNQRVEVADLAEASRATVNIAAPGASKKRETIDTYVQQYDATASRQNAIVNEYLMQVKDAPPKMALHTRDDCPLCHEPLMLVSSKAIMTCQKCGYAVTYLDATMQSMSYSDEVEFSSFSYKRINHLNEKMQQVQGKETFDIPEETLHRIMDELYKQRVSKAQITHKKIREVLKTLKLRKCYEHVANIMSKLTGCQPMQLPPEAEEMCRLMFIAVQPAFEKHAGDRKNFLSYSYCLFRFFQLLGYDDFLDSFSLLKSRLKLEKQDEIWKKITEELDWEYLGPCTDTL